jgi:hypothetical protein
MNVARREFVSGARTHSVNLGTMRNVRFAILTEVAKQMMKELKN